MSDPIKFKLIPYREGWILKTPAVITTEWDTIGEYPFKWQARIVARRYAKRLRYYDQRRVEEFEL